MQAVTSCRIREEFFRPPCPVKEVKAEAVFPVCPAAGDTGPEWERLW
jgi:hypothetical protein